MAIEYALIGDFALDGALKERLLATLGTDAKELQVGVRSKLVFELAAPLVLVGGVHTGDSPHGTMIVFRVRDKERVVEATTRAIACVAAVLEQIPDESLELWMDELLIMRRKSGHVRVSEHGSPRVPFWNAERRRLLGVPR